MVATHQVVFIGCIVVLFAGIALNDVLTRADTRTTCRFHISNTQRYLLVNGYDVIYLYSEACIDSFIAPPHKLEPLRVTMSGSTNDTRATRISCNLTHYHNNDIDGTKKTTVRMMFGNHDGLFIGTPDTMGTPSSHGLRCPDSLQVIRITHTK